MTGNLGPLLAAGAGSDPSALQAAVRAALADAGRPGTADWLREFLGRSRRPEFLESLPDDEARTSWFKLALDVIDAVGFDLGALLRQRTTEHPDHIYLRTYNGTDPEDWSYGRVRDLARATAAVLWQEGPVPDLAPDIVNPMPGPRVGLFCENSVEGAICDLACLTEGLLVSPLNTHFSEPHLRWICDRLQLTVMVCDSAERLDLLLDLRDKVSQPFMIYTLMADPRSGRNQIRHLQAERSGLGSRQVDSILASRPRRGPRDVATVMFTSGSTGLPKGVAFTQRNLISKRFARAAALPAVGRDECLLCYLPLFHTFGRFLELLGAMFWGGTYVFAGNPSTGTLLRLLGEVAPTGMISVPVRWQQIAERVWERGADCDTAATLRGIVGDRLSWGLSAAGYLDPKTFRFFHRFGVKLCSGFGMTEGTGGLTMTPPDDYVADSVGRPLPGTRIRLADNGELQVSGCYIARYLEPEAPDGSLEIAAAGHDGWWLATGDLFRLMDGGHLEIVDRIKDIYKNNRGQTIAPRVVESLFEQVPGIRRTFLAGDGRAYNTLLIVPDENDDVLRSLQDEEGRRNYFQHIINASNPSLSPWERVVNFALLERDFSVEQGEVTPKGSLRRKNIEQNFREVIAGLYQGDDRILNCGSVRVRIPRWFFRDLGILENAIQPADDTLVNTTSGTRLIVKRTAGGSIRLGDLHYDLEDASGPFPVIDLGLFARHPLLWTGNPALMHFSPCRLGWNADLKGVSPQVHLPRRNRSAWEDIAPPGPVDPSLDAINALCIRALFGPESDALAAIDELDGELHRSRGREGEIIRSRLPALARHPAQDIRCRAFQVLLLDDPHPDFQRHLPVFIESGLPFMDQDSFRAIAGASLHLRDLSALRRRLAYYRRRLSWPADAHRRTVFADLLRMLADFGRYHPEYYSAVRGELARWVRHEADPELAAQAEGVLIDLGSWYETRMRTGYMGMDPEAWRGKIAFQEGLNAEEAHRLQETLVGTTFLRESLFLAFEGEDIALQEIGPGGIWVSRILSRFEDSRFRISINTKTGKHFDLQLILFHNAERDHVRDTVLWYLALSGTTDGPRILPAFGCSRTDLGALSMAYTSDLTVWEKIREFSSVRGPGTRLPSRMRWKQLLVKAMSVVVMGWDQSGRRLIPGRITPYNIVVPEPDFRTGALLNNLTGWSLFDGPLSLLRPLYRNMIHHTLSHYPWTEFYLERTWVFDAVVEALGPEEGARWLEGLVADVASGSRDGEDPLWEGCTQDLERYLKDLRAGYHPPLALEGAIERYEAWDRLNPEAGIPARLEILRELTSLYRLDDLPEIARFTLFRRTLFRNLPPRSATPFDRLLERMHRHPDRRASSLVELSELQASLEDENTLRAFTRMAFPRWSKVSSVQLKTLGESGHGQVIVHSTLTDRKGLAYTIGEPTSPTEVGQLYRLFLQAGFPKAVSPRDHHLVVLDQAEQIVGGALYRPQSHDKVFLDGVVVTTALVERGIAAGILEEFCTRMKAAGMKVIRTQFFLRRFYEKHGFRIGRDGAGLERHL